MRTIADRRRCRGAVALSLAVAGVYIAGLAFSPAGPAAEEASAARLPGRRAVLLAPGAALGAWSAASQLALAVTSKDGKVEVQQAVDALHKLQKDWAELEKKGEPAIGEAVSQILGSTIETEVQVSVPAGESLGVEVEGLAVSFIDNKNLGWAKGDYIEEIDGTKVENKDEAVDLVKKIRGQNKPYKVIATRRTTSPFVGLQKPLQLVYQDSANPVPEVEEVMNQYSRLRNKAGFVVDGIVPASELKTQLDGFAANLDAYLAGPAPKASTKKKSAGDDDLSGLFG